MLDLMNYMTLGIEFEAHGTTWFQLKDLGKGLVLAIPADTFELPVHVSLVMDPKKRARYTDTL